MKFDYVDIGTCDFETSADEVIKNENLTALLVEPLNFYLDRLPVHKNIVKLNVAIGEFCGAVDIFFLKDSDIKINNLADHLRGCNSIINPHPAVLAHLDEHQLSRDLVQTKTVEMITFTDLCKKYNLTEIGQLKIDTEGNDHTILPDVINKITEGLVIDTIIFEYQQYMGNTNRLDQLTTELEYLGYIKTEVTCLDIKLERGR